MKKQPAYLKIYQSLKQGIMDKTYPVGTLFPPEPQLESEFKVSRTTIRKAIDLLVKDGYIVVKQGYGTQVISQKTMQNLNRLTSVSQTLKNRGFDIGVKTTYIEKIKSDIDLSNEFEIQLNTDLICISRIQLANGFPVAIAKNYILAELVPEIEKSKSKIMSLYKFLKDKYNIEFTSAKDILSACNSSFEDSNLLEIEPKTALITIKRKCYINNQIAELDLVKIIADKYEFEVYMNNQNH
ncbi:GntR family transcriptional regulator [Paludicola sp. MB14-C6]|uniref:GntR family transcriptional regulator n=1 Tax=Paludihabitans sp. MB14-C6 TaxID=3070656 RepID=UPI0027DE9666|nr:GntR family transcriptional regulator [Paludicola sp. MB14-C6]WMJ22338.1 GntR family transcriptional regulator [Paludicola sp. MB14-C6]